MKVLFKVSEWEVVIPDSEIADELLQAIKDGKVGSSEDLYDLYTSSEFSYELSEESSEQLSVEENNGEATIEVYDDEGELIWKNSNK